MPAVDGTSMAAGLLLPSARLPRQNTPVTWVLEDVVAPGEQLTYLGLDQMTYLTQGG